MRTKFKCIVVMVTIAMISSQVFALTVNNFSFEETSISNDVAWIPPAVANTALDAYGWNWFTQANAIQCGTVNENNATWAPFDAADGEIFGHIWCPGNQIAQHISGFVIDNTYPIIWSAAGRPGNADGNLWVLMDGVTIAQYDVSNTDGFIETNVNFTATATVHQLRFYHNDPWARSIFIDNVQVLPEPATIGLLALVGFAFLRRK